MIDPIPVVAIQVNKDNSLFVTTGVDYDKSGTIVGTEITSQYTLVPGDDLTGQPQEVVNLANALWTPEVIEAYKLAHPAQPEPEPEAIQIELVETPVLQEAAN
jgi:hypothetical protein